MLLALNADDMPISMATNGSWAEHDDCRVVHGSRRPPEHGSRRPPAHGCRSALRGRMRGRRAPHGRSTAHGDWRSSHGWRSSPGARDWSAEHDAHMVQHDRWAPVRRPRMNARWAEPSGRIRRRIDLVWFWPLCLCRRLAQQTRRCSRGRILRGPRRRHWWATKVQATQRVKWSARKDVTLNGFY